MTKAYNWECAYSDRAKKGWLREYIDAIFDIAKRNNKTEINFSDFLYFDITRQKPSLPLWIYKFYRPTANNIFSILNNELYLADPNAFNDVFDSKLGINKMLLRRKIILQKVKTNIGKYDFLTKELYYKLFNAPPENAYKPSFEDIFNKEWRLAIMQELNSSNWFYETWNDANIEFYEKKKLFDEHIKPRSKRIACFIAGEQNFILSHTAMWAHYADNGKGFCVQYNIEPIRNNYSDGAAPYNAIPYLKTLSVSLLPILYSSKRSILKLKHFNNPFNERYQLDIEKALLLACICKSTLWSKENEYRLILSEKDKNMFDNKIFFPFIESIYLGYNMEPSIKNCFYDFAKKDGIHIYECVQEYNGYKMNITSYAYPESLYCKAIEYENNSKHLMELLGKHETIATSV